MNKIGEGRLSAWWNGMEWLLYLLDNSSGAVVENRQLNLGNEEAKQLKVLLQPLQIPTRLPKRLIYALDAEIVSKKYSLNCVFYFFVFKCNK